MPRRRAAGDAQLAWMVLGQLLQVGYAGERDNRALRRVVGGYVLFTVTQRGSVASDRRAAR